MFIVLLGCPGSGKSTVANRLATYHDVRVLRMGRLLREAAKKEDEIGEKIRSCTNEGKLVPDEIVKVIMKKALQEMKANIIILNGFPRRMEQLPMLIETAKEQSHELKAAVILKLDKQEAEERITGRRLCPNCGATYHIQHHRPPYKKAELTQRKDDSPQTFAERFEEYEKNTVPLEKYFLEKCSDFTLEQDVSQSVDDLLQSLLPKLRKLGIQMT